MNIDTNKKNKTLETVLKLINEGYHIFPCGQNKQPAIPKGTSWLEYTRRFPTEEELQNWFVDNDYLIGVPTGECNNLTVVDFDNGHLEQELFQKLIDQSHGCYYETCSGGYHIWFKYTDKMKTIAPIKGLKKVDCRSSGGYVIFHSESVLSKLQLQTLNTSLFPTQNLLSNRSVEYTELFKIQGDGRNDRICFVIGKLLSALPQSEWESVGWELVKSYDKIYHTTSLIDEWGIGDLRRKWDSLVEKEKNKVKEEEKTTKKNNKERKSPTDEVIEIIERKIINNEVILFKSETEEPFARIKVNDHYETVSLDSKTAKRWVSKCYWEECNKSLSSETLTSALNNLEARARFDGAEYKLYNRVAKYDDSIWYDLTDSKYRAVRINENGWEIAHEPPILFKRYAHQNTQVEPQQNGDVKQFLKYINVKDKNQEILLLVAIVSYFISGFPHPIINVHGVQGSAKSTLLKLIKKLVDPSQVESTSLKSNCDEFIQYLDHHWFSAFDNISSITDSQSDTLCRAVSGDGFSKRMLYSNDDDVIRNFQRCIGLNGINLCTYKPDLLERSVLIELDRIPEEKRQSEKQLFNKFEKDRASILGGIFDAVVKAIQIEPTIVLQELPRMADFAIWGCAIAEAIGYTQEGFLDAYYSNIDSQHDEVINANIVATLITKLMEQECLWEGTATQLLDKLEDVGRNNAIFVSQHKDFPKNANSLSRKLKSLQTNLEQIGIKITFGKGRERFIKIEKIRSINDSVNNLYEIGQAKAKDIASNNKSWEHQNNTTSADVEPLIVKYLIIETPTRDEITDYVSSTLRVKKSTVSNAIKTLEDNGIIYLSNDNKYHLAHDWQTNSQQIPTP